MAFPTKPQIQTSYTAVEQALGDGSLPGQELDNDFANLKTAIDALNDFVRGITRSDGRLGNNTVTRDSLAADILLGIAPPAPWETAREYDTPDSVFLDNKFYLAVTQHTSGVFADDLASGRWVELADFTVVQAAALAAQAAAEAARNDAVDARDEILELYIGTFTSEPASAPGGGPLLAGMLYFNSDTRTMFVYTGAEWVSVSSAVSGVRDVFTYTITATTSEITGPDDDARTPVLDNARLLSVFLNGILLIEGTDYTVDVGADSVTLASAAGPGDTVQFEVFGNFNAFPPEGVSVSDIRVGGTLFTGIASQAEAETGTANDKFMTPLRAAQANAAQSVPVARTVSAGTGLTGGGALGSDLTLSADIATQGEAEVGASNAKVMTPLRVAQAVAALVPGPELLVPVTALPASGSGQIDIPEWANEIEVILREVTWTRNDYVMVQVGTASAWITSGYLSSSGAGTITDGLGTRATSIGDVRWGTSFLRSITTARSVWQWHGSERTTTNFAGVYNGSTSELSGPLTRIRIVGRGGAGTLAGAYAVIVRG